MDNPGVADAAEGKGWSRSRLAVATGLNMAIAVGYLAFKPPDTHTLSLKTRLLSAALYLLIACLVGALGTWIVLGRRSRGQFPALARCGVRGWVFVPAIVLFLRHQSAWAPLLAVLSAALMAAYLGRFTDAIPRRYADGAGHGERAIFTGQVRVEPTSWVSFVVSLCFYGAAVSAVDGRLVYVTVLLAAGAFLLVGTRARNEGKEDEKRSYPYLLVTAAFYCAFVALSASAGSSGFAARMRAFNAWEQSLAKPRPPKQEAVEEGPYGGYRGVVLWPVAKKEKIIPAAPVRMDPSSHNIARPWVIPFYGPYWYFKSPNRSPGPRAHTTQGDPLKVNVRSTDRAPLMMEAHQNLPDPIEMGCCREIQVVFRNDVALGALEVSVSLSDSRLGRPQSLGVKHVAEQPAGEGSTVEETLSFPFPKGGNLERFDRITVIFLPDASHLTAGRRVAVERFVMIP